jgi:hypothetical protein
MVCGVLAVTRRLTVRLSDEDEAALEIVMRRYGQRNAEGAIRLCVRLVAQAKDIVLESPLDLRDSGHGKS